MYKSNSKNESVMWDEKYKSSREYKSLDDYLVFSFSNPTITQLTEYIKSDSIILEVGSGTGELISYIKNSNKSVKAFGVDYSIVSIEKSIELSRKFNLNVNYSLGDIENLNFEDNTFDIIFGDQVIGHVSNMENALSELYRVLKPGGVCLLSTVNKIRFDGWDLYKKISDNHQGYTQRSFFPLNFKKILQDSGFKFVSGYGDMIFLKRNIDIIKDGIFGKKTIVNHKSTNNEKSLTNRSFLRNFYNYLETVWPWWLKISIGIVVKKA